MRHSPYNPKRIWRIFQFLLTLFLLIKKRSRFFGIKPLKPDALHDTIVHLGASFIKLAQVLATRSDFFSDAYLDALKRLHDEIPPMQRSDFKKVFNSTFSKHTFKSFEQQAIASASIGQVHVAYLHDDTKVAVKLRRKGINKQVQADIRIISFFNTIFKPLFSHYTNHSIEALIKEFSITILQEVSLNQERQNLEKFANTYTNQGVRFPKPYPKLSSDDALVMSFEEGVRFDDKETLKKLHIDFMPLINKLVHFYTEQMLVRGYFHADPHPGNLLVSKQGELILLDYGMVKHIPNDLRIAIIELIKAANERDYERYVSASKRMGTVSYEAPEHALAEFTERMFDIFDDDSLSASSMQKLAFDVLNQTKNLPFKLPQEAIYILRVSALIEGLGTTYIKNFNGIKDILPILQRSMPTALGAKETFIETLIDELKTLPLDIKALQKTLQLASEGSLEFKVSKQQISWFHKVIDEQVNAIMIGIILILASFYTLLLDRGLDALSLILFFLGSLRLIYRS